MSRHVPPIVMISVSGLLLAVLSAVGFWSGLRINLTPSYPLGLWRIDPLADGASAGDRVFICPPPDAVFEVARQRGYLGYGLCPGAFSPLIKKVVATPGQYVVIGRTISVDGVDLDHSGLRSSDGLGRTLNPAASGAVPEGHVFLFSEFPGSYDSRYFGPIPFQGILGLAEPVLVF